MRIDKIKRKKVKKWRKKIKSIKFEGKKRFPNEKPRKTLFKRI